MEPLDNILAVLSRYLHVVCTALLVGGTLFHEMVVPAAIDDLKAESQLAVFGKARWTFRWIVWLSGIVLLISGAANTVRHWDAYVNEAVVPTRTSTTQPMVPPEAVRTSPALRAGWWWAAHAATGLMSVILSFVLVGSRRAPDHPIRWMRAILIVLLIVIFLGTATSHVRQSNAERAARTLVP